MRSHDLMDKLPTVHILLASYNGAKHLPAQLESLARQTHRNWTLWVSDDGSSDDTLHIVEQFANRITQKVQVLQGPCSGSSTLNFFHLIQQAPTNNPQDLYAFCDQDDVWHDNKLERAVQWHALQAHPVRLYCGRTQFVNEQLQPIGLSRGIQRPPSFGNALVQNIASGNTMVMSHAVLVAQQRVHPEHSVWHDWTTYLVATALGGQVWFDDEPSLLYRQHSRNVIGSNDGLVAKLERLKMLFNGRFQQWTQTNLAAVVDLESMPTQSALNLHRQFETLLAMPAPWRRLNAWRKLCIRGQTTRSNLTLALGLLLALS